MAQKNYFKTVKNLVNNKNIKLFYIISPPRTCSTLLEHVLSLSQDIDAVLHEPFIKYGYNKKVSSNDGYKNIFKVKENKNKKSENILIKEMSHWIGLNKEYKKLFSLTDKPIIFLINNPLLSMESRIRKVIESIDMKGRIKTQKWLLNNVAQDEGYKNWNSFRISLQKDNEVRRKYKLLIRILKHNKNYNKPNINLQNYLLDLISRKYGYKSWKYLIKDKLYTKKDLSFFNNFLKIDKKRFDVKKSGFVSVDEQVRYLKSIGREYFIIDATDLRALPEFMVKLICKRLGIKFNKKMLKWKAKNIKINSDQSRPHDLLWYNTLLSSSGITAPLEVPLKLLDFPDFVSKYIASVELSIYANLSQNKDNAKKKIFNNIKFKINNKNFIRLRDIDPIYALTNNNSIKLHADYLNELNIVHKQIK